MRKRQNNKITRYLPPLNCNYPEIVLPNDVLVNPFIPYFYGASAPGDFALIGEVSYPVVR